jgi:hypothetical protein
MECARRLPSWYWAWLVPLLCWPVVTTWADGPSGPTEPPPWPPQNSNWQSSEATQTDSWQSFDSAWETLKNELTGWQEDSQTLYVLLETLQTEADGLRSSLTESITRYESSEAARMTEREQSTTALAEAIRKGAAAELSRNRWRTGALVATAAAAAGWAAFLLSR